MAFSKTFEHIIPFTEVYEHGWLPLVKVKFIEPDMELSLIFDTAATTIMLRPELEEFFPPSQPTEVNVAARKEAAEATETRSAVEFLGTTIDCRVAFVDLGKPNPLFSGLFGRECFSPFGFGFWQKGHELYVTLTP